MKTSISVLLFISPPLGIYVKTRDVDYALGEAIREGEKVGERRKRNGNERGEGSIMKRDKWITLVSFMYICIYWLQLISLFGYQSDMISKFRR